MTGRRSRGASGRRPFRLWRDLDLKWSAVGLSVLAGSAALGSAVALTATSAWLIARAAQLPSPADLALAAVFVRAFGLGRGVFRYLERLRSHGTALAGVASLRARTYERLEAGQAARIVTLPRGEVLARFGADLDAVGDAVVRALIPAGVAIVVSTASIGIVGSQHRGAATALAGCLVLAAVFPVLLTGRASRIAQQEGAEAEAAVVTATLSAMEGATEHRVWGTTAEAAAFLDSEHARLEKARDAIARPTSLAQAILVLAQGAALAAAVAIAIAAASAGDLTGPAAAVVALTPLAAFEAVGALPAATSQAYRSRTAFRRVDALLESAGSLQSSPTAPLPSESPSTDAAPGPVDLELLDVRAAWPGGSPTRPVSAVLRPGEILGIVGPSGIGKTTLLLTTSGALPPHSGRVLLGGRDATPKDAGSSVALTAEDGHVFGTTVLENLRVARGDVTPAEATQALLAVGLGDWLSRLPAGLDTPLGSGGGTVSGGERRRLLLARALLCPAPIHLIDEPAEHLDEAGADVVRSVVRQAASRGTTVVLVTHERAILDVVDTVIDLGEGE